MGSDDDVDDLVVDGDVLRLGDLAYPVAPGTGSGTGREVHDRQHYTLIGWRHGVCGYRRFFSITSLAGLRQEDRAVFDASHVEVKRWFDEGLVDGVRIDHPDGLADPAGYLTWLREITGPQAWIVIEKILAVDEPLDLSLPVAGTTGYDALREIGGLFVDPAGEGPLTALVDSTGAHYDEMPQLARTLKVGAVTDTLHSERDRLCRAITAATDHPHPQLGEAVAELLSHIGVYRSDYPSLASVLSIALAETAVARPDLAEPLSVVSVAVGAGGEAAVRLQQLCGAATAKSMEDCLFYRDPRLVSLNEVGGEPDRFGVSLAEFHQRAAVRAALWPHAMTALSTHDTKRGEDVRARIGVLSQVPSLWAEFAGAWERRLPSPDPMTGLFLLQNIFGVWPVDGAVTDDLRARLHGYAEKAIREAGVHTTWNDPDTAFEHGVHTLDRRHPRRPDRHGTDEDSGTPRRVRPQRQPGPEADPADRTRRARRLPGHRTVGRQPGRPRQPQTGRLHRATRGAGGLERRQDPGGDGGVAAAPRQAGCLPRRRLPPPARRGSCGRTPGGVRARVRCGDRRDSAFVRYSPKQVGAKRS